MLKGIDPRMSADLLDTLMRMGHGDELVLADSNFPSHSTAAETVTGAVIELPGLNAPQAIALICSALPLDAFVPAGALFMQADGQGEVGEPVHEEGLAVIRDNLPEGGGAGSIERHEFYRRARKAFAVVRCSEPRAFGCFILRKGVIF